MKRFSLYLLVLLIFTASVSCTSGRWVVKNTSAVDSTDYNILESKKFLAQAKPVSPQDPILQLQLLSSTTYEYAQKVEMQRMIQKYKLRPAYVILGLAGAGLAIYAAKSDVVAGGGKSTILYGAGGLLGLTGFLNMKPSGEPRATGEKRYLRKTGTQIVTDTVKVTPEGSYTANIDLLYGSRLVRQEQNTPLSSGFLNVDLGSAMSSLSLQGDNPGMVHANVDFLDSTYTYSFPLQKVLEPYARINVPLAKLRNAPAEADSTVLAELVQGSELQITDEVGEKWYKVLYGISENYLLRSDVTKIWRTSDYSRQNQVVAVPTIPFGNVDVENNIPILSGINEQGMALIISNENYTGAYSTRSYTRRDGKLISTYLENALGYTPQRIFTIDDLHNPAELQSALDSMRTAATDSTELFVYLGGYGQISKANTGYHFELVPSNADTNYYPPEPVSLGKLFSDIANLPASKTIVLSDISFATPADSTLKASALKIEQPLDNLAGIITGTKSGSAVIFGSQIDQASQLYVSKAGDDKKHHIFPYFFAKALQSRKTTLAEIYQYLERNISYTARRLHDRSQDPSILGNITLDLVDRR